MKLCPECGGELNDVIGGYMCPECGRGMFSEDEVIVARCPVCNDELGDLCDEYYCYNCNRSVSKDDAVCSGNTSSYNNYDFEEPDYESMIDNGDEICLNCTYWNVSPYGASNGMVCNRGYPTSGPGDSCSDFIQSQHYANYGDSGQFQFDETGMDTSNKLYHWKNSR